MKANFVSSKETLKRVFLFCFLVGFVLAVIFCLPFKEAVGSDLVSYLTGARILRQDKSSLLYDLETQHYYQQEVIRPVVENNTLPYLNFPLLATLFIPLSFLPLLSAYKIFVLVLFAVLFLISKTSLKVFVNLRNTGWFILPFIFYPSFGAVLTGQIALFLVLCFLLIYFNLVKKRYFLAGLLSGLLLLKIQYIILVPYLFFLIKTKKEYVKGFLISAFTVFILSNFVSGLGIWSYYLKTILATQKPEYGIRVSDMFTLHSSLSQLSILSNFSYLDLFLVNVFVYLGSVVAVYWFAKRVPLGKIFASVVILTLVFCVHGVNYDLSLLLIPILFLLNEIRGNLIKKKKPSSADLIAILILLISPVLYPLGMSFIISFLYLFTVLVMIFPVKSGKKFYFSKLNLRDNVD